MNRIIFTLIGLLNIAPLFAQHKKIAAFGKIDKAELLMKDCDFDPGAEAVKLIDWGTMYYDRGSSSLSPFKTFYERRVRIKILSEKGLDYANVTIPYFGRNNDERIAKIEAFTYNLDDAGNIVSAGVSKESYYNKKIDRNFSQLSFAFPAVKPGSIIEYKYTLERESMGHIKNWYFQDRIPTAYSEYLVKIPSLLIFDIQPTIADANALEVKVEETRESINTNNGGFIEFTILNKNFILRNQPGIRQYAYMGAVSDYLQRLEFQLKRIDYGNGETKELRTTWADLVTELMKDDDFGKILNAPLDELKQVISEAKNHPGKKDKISYLLKFFRKEFTCTDDEGIYSFTGWKKLWAEKKGTCGDISLAFINALKQAGIEVLPLLVSSRDNGLVNSSYPFLNQFNKVLACIPDGDMNYVINAADKYQVMDLFPADVVNTRGFVVSFPSGRFIDLVDNTHQYKAFIANKAEISVDGKITGECIANYSEFGKMTLLNQLHENKKEYLRKNFIAPWKDVKVDSIQVLNAEADTRQLEHKIKYSSAISSSGNYSYFNINLFTGLHHNPFLDETRYADVDFGYKQQYSIFGNYLLPSGFEFEELPKNILLQMPDGSATMTCHYAAEGNMLNIRFDIVFKSTFYEMAVYPEFKAFYKQMLDKLNEQIVIKKVN